MTSAATQVLVDTQWVADHLNDPSVKLVEVDVDTTQYDEGHVPGAIAWNWTTDTQDQLRRDILNREQFQDLMRRSGIRNEDTVILYGDNNNWFAAYALWLMKIYGHDDVRLMDGGRKKWLEENRPLTKEVPQPQPSNYIAKEADLSIRATRDDILPRLGRSELGLVDVRSPAEFTGEILAPPGLSETAQRGGHIPGAMNIPWGQAVREDGTFKSPEELRQLYGSKGIDESKQEIIAYCRIGERSSHTWFALKYLLGYPNVKNYDGSWTEWGSMVGVPVEKP